MHKKNVFASAVLFLRKGFVNAGRKLILNSSFIVGFRKNYSIFIDLQKVFETVDHETLLSNLYYYGLRGACGCTWRSIVVV